MSKNQNDPLNQIEAGNVPNGFMEITVPLLFLDKLYPTGVPDEVMSLVNKKDEAPEGFINLILPNEVASDIARIGLTSDWASDIFPEGLMELVQGYFDYAKLLLLDRAVPSIDGFKQVQRRAFYAIHQMKKKVGEEIKSTKVASDTLIYHPHNPDVIYEAITRFVDSTMYTNLPLLNGIGSFGHRNQSGMIPAARYTFLARLPFTDRLYQELEGGVKYGRTEDDLPEPELLPVQVPYGLFMPTSGVGLGTGSKYFSYNPKEVIDYILEIIKNGSSDRVLAPDFPTGGFVRNNPKAFRKVMEQGVGQVELTSKWRVEGNTIEFFEIQFYTTVSKVIKEVQDLKIPTISLISDGTSHDTNQPSVIVQCTDASYVDYTLKRILKETSLHMRVNASMLTVVDRQPRVIGVAEYVQEWLKFRSNVISTFYGKQIKAIITMVERLKFIVEFTSNQSVVKQFIDEVYKGNQHGVNFIKEKYPNATKEGVDAVMGLRISSLADKETRRTRITNLEREMKELQEIVENPHKQIKVELEEIKREIDTPRRTEIVEEDYSYRKVELLSAEEKEEADKEYFVTVRDGFAFKYPAGDAEATGVGYWAKNEEYLIIGDLEDRLIRIPISEIPSVKGNSGLYVQAFAGFDISEGGAPLTFFNIMERDKEQLLLYRDGYASVIKHNEWLDAKYVTKVNVKGLPQGYSPDLVAMLLPSKEYHLVQTTTGRIVVFRNDYKQKERTARTKVISGLNARHEEQVARAVSLSATELLNLFTTGNTTELVNIHRLYNYGVEELDYDLLEEYFTA